ncbi:ATP-dependent DNA helicase [Aeromicrobium piscarium]|uniref:ATP-dependent helicase DinG n=1 Tax=Aeromicrobium piscarium TaxID=2590901 RepID=A0A554S9U6_9ACTN|nr:ATP-dependent DNA helicase [Aeromicrobium piscarium]TSD63116.1 ATP-dependent DNA helicase [Aeromicrobium piscarium]
MASDVRDVLSAAVDAVGGTERPGQIAMAEAVQQAFDTEQHLLVQAGTGTGKSLGYLVPSLLHDQRVVIATATLNLQHQLVERDIPALKEAAREVLDDVPHHAVVKGRGNYACLHRVREGAPDDQGTLVEVPEGTLGAEVVALREWAEQQADGGHVGDRDAAPSHNERAWRQVSVTARECLGAQRCPYALECFAERAREDAQQAHIVVTNHAMLAIDAIDGVPMLPEFGTVVIDEAHELAARVTQAATQELDPAGIERAARRARPHLTEPEAADDLSDAADALADTLTHVSPGRIEEPPQPLRAALDLVRDTARACFSAFGKERGGEEPDPARQQARSAVDELRQVAERMARGSDTDVLWLGELRTGQQLRIAPIDVSGALRDKLFGEKTVVLTSATLALGGSFDPVARSLGLWEDAQWRGLDVGSPFDYAKQGMLYVARHLPAPGRDGLEEDQLGEITALVKAAGGRTLGLFSSRRGAERAAEYVRMALPDIEVLCQGDAQLPELARRFAEEPSTCLFGTLSLWQGVDLPGDTCTLVIIDRIPFPRPDDPLMSARQRLVEKRGGNGFMQVAAHHAALLLAQGAGRLIRRADDRGVVAMLDPRIVTARYGGFLAASMPPLWRTTDRATVMAALGRLDAAAVERAAS